MVRVRVRAKVRVRIRVRAKVWAKAKVRAKVRFGVGLVKMGIADSRPITGSSTCVSSRMWALVMKSLPDPNPDPDPNPASSHFMYPKP